MCLCVRVRACVRACVRDRFSWNRAIRKRQFRLPGFDLAIMLHKQGVILHLAPWRIPLTHSRGRPPGRKRSSSSLPMRTTIVSPSCLPYLAPPAASTVSSCACYSGMLIGRARGSSGLRDSWHSPIKTLSSSKRAASFNGLENKVGHIMPKAT